MGIFHTFTGIKGDSGAIIVNNGDVPRIIVRAPEAVLVEPAILLSGVIFWGFANSTEPPPTMVFQPLPPASGTATMRETMPKVRSSARWMPKL